MDSKYVSLPTAAKMLNYSISSLHRWVKEGRLKVYRASPSSHPRVKISDLDALMKDSEAIAPAGADLDTIWAALCKKHGLKDRSKQLH